MDDLRAYTRQKNALRNIKERIAALQAQAEGLRTQRTDTVPVQGGASRTEERLLDSIVERDRLRENYRITRERVEAVERGLAALSEEERFVLMGFAEADRRDKCVAERLAASLHLGRATVYRIRDEALYRFTLQSYGVIDL